jgi:hypothetical protein
MDRDGQMDAAHTRQTFAKRRRAPQVSPEISELVNMLSSLEGQFAAGDGKPAPGR